MARTRRSKRPRFSQTCSRISPPGLTEPNGLSNTDINLYLSNSDSSKDSFTVTNQGVVDDSGATVVRAVEVVKAKAVKQEDLSKEESSNKEQSALIVKWQVKDRIAEGKSLVESLEQELLSGLSGSWYIKRTHSVNYVQRLESLT